VSLQEELRQKHPPGSASRGQPAVAACAPSPPPPPPPPPLPVAPSPLLSVMGATTASGRRVTAARSGGAPRRERSPALRAAARSGGAAPRGRAAAPASFWEPTRLSDLLCASATGGGVYARAAAGKSCGDGGGVCGEPPSETTASAPKDEVSIDALFEQAGGALAVFLLHFFSCLLACIERANAVFFVLVLCFFFFLMPAYLQRQPMFVLLLLLISHASAHVQWQPA